MRPRSRAPGETPGLPVELGHTSTPAEPQAEAEAAVAEAAVAEAAEGGAAVAEAADGEAAGGEVAVAEVAVAGPAAVRFRIWRHRPAAGPGHFDDFEWQAPAGATVLDALLEFRASRDRSLVVRHSCMHGSCGTCSVRVNGRESLACDVRIGAVTGRAIRVEPVRGQRPVADLAVDSADFHARMDAVGMPMVRVAESSRADPPEGVRSVTRFEGCIECGLCLSACPVARTDGDYIGPAALAAAARLVEEPRGRSVGPILDLAAEPDSVWRCRDIMECSVVCPEAVDPARLVIGLRRRIAVNALRSIFRRSNGDR